MNDILEVVKDLMNLAIQKNVTVSTAESCTGGLIAKYLTDLSGSSNFFDSSIIVYSNSSKTSLLNVPKMTIDKKGAVSEETVKEMAKGLLKITNSTVVIAVSGIMELNSHMLNQKETGVWFCWQSEDVSKTLYSDLKGERIENRVEAAKIGILGLYDFIKEI